MSGDCIGTTRIVVYVQENGIIRAESNGYLIGRLSRDFNYEDLSKLAVDHVIYDVDEMEHYLNCWDNLFYIHEQNGETRKKWDKIIYEANQAARQKWCDIVRKRIEAHETLL